MVRSQPARLAHRARAARGVTPVVVALALGLSAWGMAAHPWLRPLLHNGLLLPVQLLLILVCALGGQPRNNTLARLAARLGNASLSIFALHVPLFLLYLKLEKLAGVDMSPGDCLLALRACALAARTVPAAPANYWIYLASVIGIAVLFQERIVAPARQRLQQWLLRRIGAPLASPGAADPGPAATKTPTPAVGAAPARSGRRG
jgi:peptidoglycan/LPS O-acetylase OafA/YrhL